MFGGKKTHFKAFFVNNFLTKQNFVSFSGNVYICVMVSVRNVGKKLLVVGIPVAKGRRTPGGQRSPDS